MIINKTKNKVISKKTKLCAGFLSKLKGLMFSSKAAVRDNSYVFVFGREHLIGLHMWFVFYPIDVMFLNSEQRVVQIKENLLPFAFYFPTKKAKYVVEMAEGSIQKNKIKIGDLIEFGGGNGE